MRISPPDDWNKTEWECVEIQWPKSDKWLALLVGLITTPMRGRTWDERHGSVIDAQLIGREIDARNIPFMSCSGATIEYNTEYLYRLIEAEEGEFIMSLCGYNPKAFKVENGVLYVRDFCGEWVAIGAVGAGGSGDPVYTTPDNVDTEETPIYTCGMAVAVADLIEELGGYIWDESDNTIPVFMPTKAQNYIGLDLNNIFVLDAANQALIMKGAVIVGYGTVDLERSDVINDVWSEELACFIEPIMSSDGTVDREALFSAVKTWVDRKYNTAESGNNIFIKNFWNYVISAIGSGNMTDIAVAGQYTDSGNCPCPNEETGAAWYGPTAAGWYLELPTTVTGFPIPYDNGGDYPFDTFGYPGTIERPKHDVYGVWFQAKDFSGSVGTIKRVNPPGLYTGADVYMTNSNSDNLTAGNVYLQAGGTAGAQLAAAGASFNLLSDGGGVYSDNPASPAALAGQLVSFSLSVQEGALQQTCTFAWGWLYNVNSPSHSA